MILWHDHSRYQTTRARDIKPLPVADLIVLILMLVLGVAGYQAVRTARDLSHAPGRGTSAAVVLSRAVQTVGGGR